MSTGVAGVRVRAGAGRARSGFGLERDSRIVVVTSDPSSLWCVSSLNWGHPGGNNQSVARLCKFAQRQVGAGIRGSAPSNQVSRYSWIVGHQ